MPELPEVETVRRDLEKVLVGRVVDEVDISGRRVVRRQSSGEVVKALTGASIDGLRRLGKFLLIDISDEKTFEKTLVVHLRMSGQLRWFEDKKTPSALHTHARLGFGDSELRFIDPRTFGEWWVTTNDVPELGHIGPDSFESLPSIAVLHEGLANRKSALKTRLLDQSYLAGIGNIYADEICFLAKLRPSRIAGSVSLQGTGRLHEAITTVLKTAVEKRGSSLADKQYVDLHGELGLAQTAHYVYAREGQPCLECSSTIKRIVIGGRSAFYCPRCQR